MVRNSMNLHEVRLVGRHSSSESLSAFVKSVLTLPGNSNDGSTGIHFYRQTVWYYLQSGWLLQDDKGQRWILSDFHDQYRENVDHPMVVNLVFYDQANNRHWCLAETMSITCPGFESIDRTYVFDEDITQNPNNPDIRSSKPRNPLKPPPGTEEPEPESEPEEEAQE